MTTTAVRPPAASRQRRYQLLIRHAEPKIETGALNAFLEDLNHHPAQSIDVYLENRYHYVATALPIGKALIAGVMEEQLQQNGDRLNRGGDDWLGYVLDRMREGAETWQAFNEGNTRRQTGISSCWT